MSYKKYIRRGGKRFGPYFYESYRDKTGKVKKRYVGTTDFDEKGEKRGVLEARGIGIPGKISEKKLNFSSVFNYKFLVIFGIAVLLAFSVFLLNFGFTGRASLDISSSYISGENIIGSLLLNLREGELIPADSKLIIKQTSRGKEALISDIVLANSTGNYYAEGFNISGQGDGIGYAGKREIYPYVYFTLVSSGAVEEVANESRAAGNETSGGGAGVVENESEIPIVPVPSEESEENATEETPSEIPSETPVEETPATETPAITPTTPAEEKKNADEKAAKEEQKAVEKEEKAEEKDSPATETGTTPAESSVPAESSAPAESAPAPITGGIVMENEIEGRASRNESFEYAGEDMKIKSRSVYSDVINKIYERSEVIELHSYENLSSDVLNLNKENGKIVVSTDYSYEESGFGEDYLGDKKEIKIDLTSLGVAAESGKLTISLVYGDVVLAEVSKEISVLNETTLIINETEINVTEKNATLNLNETLKRGRIVVGKPVKWLKKIKVDSGNLHVEIPKEAENISVKTGGEIAQAELEMNTEDNSVQNKLSLITGNVISESSGNGFFTRIWRWFTITGKVISEDELGSSITENADNKIVDVSGIAPASGEIAVEYTTPAPTSSEEITGNGKRIVISAVDGLNYTNVLAYTQLDNIAPVNSSRIRLYWHASYEDAVRYGYAEGRVVNEIVSNESVEIVNETENVVNETVESNQTETLINESETLINNSEQVVNNNVSEAVVEQNNSVVEDKKEEKEAVKEEKKAEQDAKKEEKKAGKLTGNVIGEAENLTESNLTVINQTIEEEVNVPNVTVVSSVPNEVIIEVNYTAYDLDSDGNVDYIEWNVPHLSEQVYEIIYISKADELDSNYTFIRDVYEQVKSFDNNYTTIAGGNYLRVTFEQNLTSSKDITIYAKDSCNGTISINNAQVPCEIYEKKKRIDEIGGEINGGYTKT